MAPATVTNDGRMADRSVRILAGYLLATAVLTFYMVYALWSAGPRATSSPLPTPPCAADATRRLTHIHPATVNVGSGGEIWLIGCGFTNSMVVKLNAAQHPASFVDARHIRATLAASDVAAPATIVIGLFDGTAEVATGSLSVVTPGVAWGVFGLGPWTLSQEVQLLLLVLFTGAFGSCIYALKSLADYRGDHDLCESWFLFYVIQPVQGAGIAFLLYMVIRGGFLAGTGADVKTVNQFGICAIAGLAGAFSDVAFLKLREVFLTLFKPRDDRGDKPGLKVTTTSLPDATVGAAYKQTLQASSGVAPLKWSINPALSAGLSLDTNTGIISGTPTASSPKTTYTVTVADSGSPAASHSAGVTLEVKDAPAGLKVTTTSLPNATVGAAYTQTLQASGGVAPLKWSANPALPAGLSLDSATGIISGTPAASSPKATFRFTVTDSARPAGSASADIALEIK